jgi:hypothetical protein
MTCKININKKLKRICRFATGKIAVDVEIYVLRHTYHNSGKYPKFSILVKTLRFGNWIISPSLGGTYSVGTNR